MITALKLKAPNLRFGLVIFNSPLLISDYSSITLKFVIWYPNSSSAILSSTSI